MKKLLSCLTLILFITSIKAQKDHINFNTLQLDNVSEIYIAANCSPVDSCRFNHYLLTKDMTIQVLKLLKTSKIQSKCEYDTEYYLYLTLKDSTYTFETNKEFISNNNTCVLINEEGVN